MGIKDVFKPKKSNTVLTLLVYGIIHLLVFSASMCCFGFLDCKNKPRHSVPGNYPNAYCCQVCATSTELFMGYLVLFLKLYLPTLIVVYILSSILLGVLEKNHKT